MWRSDKDDRSKGKDFEDQTELRVRKVDLLSELDPIAQGGEVFVAICVCLYVQGIG